MIRRGTGRRLVIWFCLIPGYQRWRQRPCHGLWGTRVGRIIDELTSLNTLRRAGNQRQAGDACENCAYQANLLFETNANELEEQPCSFAHNRVDSDQIRRLRIERYSGVEGGACSRGVMSIARFLARNDCDVGGVSQEMLTCFTGPGAVAFTSPGTLGA